MQPQFTGFLIKNKECRKVALEQEADFVYSEPEDFVESGAGGRDAGDTPHGV